MPLLPPIAFSNFEASCSCLQGLSSCRPRGGEPRCVAHGAIKEARLQLASVKGSNHCPFHPQRGDAGDAGSHRPGTLSGCTGAGALGLGISGEKKACPCCIYGKVGTRHEADSDRHGVGSVKGRSTCPFTPPSSSTGIWAGGGLTSAALAKASSLDFGFRWAGLNFPLWK